MEEKEKIEMEQHKIFIESAEKNSDKRITQNNIYLTINLAFLSYVITQNLSIEQLIITTIVGIIMCIIWFLTINNYSKRNEVKYQIINESEFGSLYKEEWKRVSILTPLTFFEKTTSIIFMILYITLIIVNIL